MARYATFVKLQENGELVTQTGRKRVIFPSCQKCESEIEDGDWVTIVDNPPPDRSYKVYCDACGKRF